eukprot:scaffold83456_cov37-Prasinocladus_malaysianus.AAC.1
MDDTAGSYYWDMIDRVLSIAVKGNEIITIRTQNAVKTSLLVQTSIEEFFSAQSSFIDLLAGVLNIPASTIRIVEIVEATSRRHLLQNSMQVSFAVVSSVSAPPPPSPPPPPPPPPPPHPDGQP